MTRTGGLGVPYAAAVALSAELGRITDDQEVAKDPTTQVVSGRGRCPMSNPQIGLLACAIAGVLALTTIGLVVFFRPSISGWKALGATSLAFLTLIGTVAGSWYSARASAAAPVTQTQDVTPQMKIAVDSPKGTAPMCTVFTGTAKLAEGYSMAVANRRVDDTRWYFEGTVDLTVASGDEQGWSAQLELGDPSEKKGSAFEVQAIILPTDWVKYLSSTDQDPENTYWSDNSMPPGALEGNTLTVTRSDSKGC